MADQKDIGEAFKDKLKGFDSSPSSLTWEDIEPHLPKERRPFLYWIKVTGITLLLLLLIFPTYNAYKNSLTLKTSNPTTIENTTITDDCEEEKIDLEKNNRTVIVYNGNTKETTSLSTPSKPNIDAASSIKNKQSSYHRNSTSNTIQSSSNTIQSNSNSTSSKLKSSNTDVTFSTSNTKKAISIEENKGSLVEKTSKKHTDEVKNNSNLIANQNIKASLSQTASKDKLEHKEDSIKAQSTLKKDEPLTNRKKKSLIYMYREQKELFQKYSIAIHITPTYTIPSNISLISNLLTESGNNAKHNDLDRLSLGYGIIFKTFNTKKAAIRIGYNRLKINHTVKNIRGDRLKFALSNSGILLSGDQIIGNSEEVDLIQKVTYNEISFGIQYQIADKQISTSLIGGTNFIFPGKNSIKINAPSNSFTVEGSSNLQKVGFIMIVGSNFQYKLSKNIFLNVEPLINYQINDTSKDSEIYKSLYFTIQTGLSYKF